MSLTRHITTRTLLLLLTCNLSLLPRTPLSTHRKFTDELRDRYGVRASFQLIRNAGHHLYMDNVGHFHSVIDSWLEKEHLCGSI